MCDRIGGCLNNIITNITLLKKLESLGHIKLHPHTGKKVTTPFGATVTAHYIDGLVDGWFTYKGRTYTTEYVSGSFYPYLMEV